MIVAGPYTALIGRTTLTLPISTDTYAIAIINLSPLFISAASAGMYAHMAVPPRMADIFRSPDSASQQITFTITDPSKQFSLVSGVLSDGDSPYNFYVYLYGSADPVAMQMQANNATGYPYALDLPNSQYQGYIELAGSPPVPVQNDVVVESYPGSPGVTLQAFVTGSYIWGFDLTYTYNSTVLANSTVSLADVAFPGNILHWNVVAPVTQEIHDLIIRFPFPIAIVGAYVSPDQPFGSMQCTFTIPSMGNCTPTLNVYCTL